MENRRKELIGYVRLTLADYNITRALYNSIIDDKAGQIYEDRRYRLNKLARDLKIMKQEINSLYRQISNIDRLDT